MRWFRRYRRVLQLPQPGRAGYPLPELGKLTGGPDHANATGFFSGLAISATLTYQYGDSWYQRLHQQAAETVTAVHSYSPMPTQTPTPSPSLMEAAASTIVAAAPTASPVAGPVPAAMPSNQAEDETEAAWSAFMNGTDALAARGDFPWRDCFRRAAASHDVPELLLAGGRPGARAASMPLPGHIGMR